MDYLLKTRLHSDTAEILNTATQQAVDLDFTLADYCPDIEKILKCSLTPRIYSRSFSAGELRVDGSSLVKILYCDQDKKTLRCCEQAVPFSAVIPVTADVAENIIFVSAKQEYLNCRALTPRRLTVHGAFTLYTEVLSRAISSIAEDSQDDKLQVLKKDINVCELCEFNQEQFTVVESVPLSGKNRVESIIRSELSASLTDFNISMDKLNIKGEITLRMLYLCDAKAGECDRFVYVFPFTQSVDAKNSDLDITDIQLDVLCYDLLLKSDILSEDPSLTIDAKMCVSVMGFKKQTMSYICDAYSTEDNAELDFSNIKVCSNIHPLKIVTSVKSPLYLGERKICRILDIYNDPLIIKGEISGKTLRLFGKVNVCILGFSEEGELLCVERQVDVDLTETVEEGFTYVRHCIATITSLSYRMSDNNELEIRMDMRLGCVLCCDENIRQVTSVMSSGEFTNPMGEDSLVLCYADKGDKIWDIAKKYKASVSSLCLENNLSEDVLSSQRMLLILRE